jgi:hypothetical protein
MNKKLLKRENELAQRYDAHCHDYPTNHGYTIWLKEAFKFGENIKPGELEFFDDERMEINGFYTWKGRLYLTDGCGDSGMEMLSDSEADRFLNYISDENNLKFEH